MDKNLQNIEDLFKKGLEGNEEAPSDEVWNSIDQSLEKANSLKFKRKYYSLKRATAVLVVILALLTVYVLRNESHKQAQSNTTNKNIVTSEPAIKNDATREEEIRSESINQIPSGSKIESKSGEINKLNSLKEPANQNLHSRRMNNASEGLQSTGAIASGVAPVNKINEARQKEVQQNKPVEKIQPPINPEEKNINNFQAANRLIVPPVIHFSPYEIPRFNGRENLKDIATISPYASPARIAKTTLIHLTKPPRFYASIFYSPKLAFSHLRDEDQRFGNPYSRELEKNEKGSYSYSFGILVDYRINNKWAVESGLNFSTIKMNLEPGKIYAERDNQGKVKYQINTSSGKAYVLPSFSSNPQVGDSLYTKKIDHSLQYTSIPLAAKYYFTGRRLSLNLVAGVSTNIFSNGKISTEVNRGNESEHEKTHEIHGLKPLYFSGLAGFGFSYNLYKNLSLTFSPTFNFAIDPINRDVPVNSYPGTLDFQVGLKSRL